MSTPRKGRIEKHGGGAGPVSPEDVEKRAGEIARIEGRDAHAVNEDDRERARRELHGETLPPASEEPRTDTVATRNPADMAVRTGHEKERKTPADEQEDPDREVREGLREAEHERMLRARESQPE